MLLGISRRENILADERRTLIGRREICLTANREPLSASSSGKRELINLSNVKTFFAVLSKRGMAEPTCLQFGTSGARSGGSMGPVTPEIYIRVKHGTLTPIFLGKSLKLLPPAVRFRLKCTEFDFGGGSAADPDEGAYSALFFLPFNGENSRS